MKDLKIITKLKVATAITELDTISQNLMQKAQSVLKHSYSPYSQFQVGAAALLDNNKIVTGTNQENASFPIGLCAERVALAAITSLYPKAKILKIAITIKNNKNPTPSPVSPCGMCRQVLFETEKNSGVNIELLLKGEGDEVIVVNSIKDLLPLSFDGEIIA